MTYCVGLKLNDGIVMLSDSRTNAGVDSIGTFAKLYTWENPGDRVLAIMTAGNLSVSQEVMSLLRNNFTDVVSGYSLMTAPTMFDAAGVIGAAIRFIDYRDGTAIRGQGADPSISLLFGGQIGSEPQNLYMLYYAGNFIEATADTPFLQLGETKYGKPILDRVIRPETNLIEAAKCALVSMDSTLRSNVSVGLPLDLVMIKTGDLRFAVRERIHDDNAYFNDIRGRWGEGLRKVFQTIPDPDWGL